MKAFIAGVITLSLLITTITVNAILIINKTDRILEEINALSESVETADDTRLQMLWKNSRSWIALTVHRENVDDIDDILTQLELEIAEQNSLGYLREKKKLLTTVKRLKKTESFSFSRIF